MLFGNFNVECNLPVTFGWKTNDPACDIFEPKLNTILLFCNNIEKVSFKIKNYKNDIKEKGISTEIDLTEVNVSALPPDVSLKLVPIFLPILLNK